MRNKIITLHGVQMQWRALTFDDTVSAIRVRHEVELSIVLDQFILQSLCTLVMYVVFARAMYQQQFTHQILGMGYRWCFFIIVFKFSQQTRITQAS